MLAFVGLETRDARRKLRVAVAECGELFRIMGVDLVLDRGGASHGRLRAHERGGGAQRMAGDRPEWLQDGRADAARREQVVKMLQMLLFLRGHAADLAGERMVLAEHGELAGIDAGRAIFPGLVDAQHRGGVGPRVTGAPGGRRRAHMAAGVAAFGFLKLNHRITNAEDREMIAFHPAIEMPNNDHCTSSQRTIGRLKTWFNMSSAEPARAAVHWVAPGSSLSSMPACQTPIAPLTKMASAASQTRARPLSFSRGPISTAARPKGKAAKWA